MEGASCKFCGLDAPMTESRRSHLEILELKNSLRISIQFESDTWESRTQRGVIGAPNLLVVDVKDKVRALRQDRQPVCLARVYRSRFGWVYDVCPAALIQADAESPIIRNREEVIVTGGRV